MFKQIFFWGGVEKMANQIRRIRICFFFSSEYTIKKNIIYLLESINYSEMFLSIEQKKKVVFLAV